LEVLGANASIHCDFLKFEIQDSILGHGIEGSLEKQVKLVISGVF
jgi:hypothetical protein